MDNTYFWSEESAAIMGEDKELAFRFRTIIKAPEMWGLLNIILDEDCKVTDQTKDRITNLIQFIDGR